jgi:hypothetical protein
MKKAHATLLPSTASQLLRRLQHQAFWSRRWNLITLNSLVAESSPNFITKQPQNKFRHHVPCEMPVLQDGNSTLTNATK